MNDWLEEIETRAEKATPGPWVPWCERGWPKWMVRLMGIDVEAGIICPIAPEGCETENGELKEFIGGFAKPADQMFACRARTDIPALIARVRELEAENERLRGQMTYWKDQAHKAALKEPGRPVPKHGSGP